MAEKLYVLTEADLLTLKEMAEEHRRKKPTARPSSWLTGREDPTAPEVYVAWVPSGGIPALDDRDTTGSGTEEGTGTGSSQMDDVVGSAMCQIYRCRVEGGVRNLFPLGREYRVHNLMTTAVPGFRWILIVRDKFGTWWVNPLPFDLAACP